MHALLRSIDRHVFQFIDQIIQGIEHREVAIHQGIQYSIQQERHATGHYILFTFLTGDCLVQRVEPV